ncbi:hypothetical protein EGT07_02655 [Herbaspirillum sp. HC18]|nr:hypothetical protein EGT07_02655 [Herbaspirillum sp. HC18]
MKSLYEVLGTDRGASAAEIEQRYYGLLSRHLAGNRPLSRKDQQRVQQVRQAYLLLSSPRRRRDYDAQLKQRERARARTVVRMGGIAGTIMLVAGLALIGRSYFRLQTPEPPAVESAANKETMMVGKR